MRRLLLFSISLHALFVGRAGTVEAAVAEWVNISDPVVNQLAAEGKKQDWPYQTAGVVCDAMSGDVFMVLPGQGLWKSSDRGKRFSRVDGGAIGGRCETSFSLNVDPSGKRLACFMLDGATWEKLGVTCPGTIGPLFDPATEKHLVIAGARGIFETTEGGRNWVLVAPLPAKFDVPKPGGWFTNVAWDAANDIFYASRMGFPTYKLERKKGSASAVITEPAAKLIRSTTGATAKTPPKLSGCCGPRPINRW